MIDRLILMRHAKSSWKYPELSDHERPLNKRGKKAAVQMANELIRLKWIPNKLYSSDSTRTKETWARMNKIIKGVEVEYLHKLYHSSPAKIRKSLPNEFDFKTIMILGHNPGCADFLAHLCSEWHRMPTAATALLTINNPNESWKIKGNWDLEELILPREL
tara:strand:+ start:2213 stop:2695 length:483 start_codon:yes stop_codon:yes gene_type:complete